MTAPGFCNAHDIALVPVVAAGGVWNTCPRCEAESREWSEVTSGNRQGHGQRDAEVAN